MGPEAKFYKYFKSKTPEIIYTRIENTSSLGTPDALCYNANQFYFTIEFKVSKRNKVSLSAHQIAYHYKHPKNTFILAEARGPRAMNRFHMYRGSRILELEASGLKLDACSFGLDACYDFFSKLGA